MNGTLNLKLFLSISFGLHLFVLSFLSILMPDIRIIQLPRLNIEVSLLSLAREERDLPKRVENSEKVRRSEFEVRSKEIETKTEAPEPVKNHEDRKISLVEKVEVTLPTKEQELIDATPVQNEVGVVSISNPMPFSPEIEKKIIESRQEERIIVASLGNPVQPVSSSEKPQTVMRSPSLSEGGSIFAQPRYSENPKPLYPQEARKKGFEGEVLLHVEVLSDGRVGEIEVRRSSGHEILDRSAIKAVKQWKFVPAKKAETPVPVWVNIPVAFQLR